MFGADATEGADEVTVAVSDVATGDPSKRVITTFPPDAIVCDSGNRPISSLTIVTVAEIGTGNVTVCGGG